MEVRVLHSIVAAATLAFSAPAFAQSGSFLCEQDLARATVLYRQKQSALTEAERREATELMEAARSKCQSGGQEGLNTRSKEATALLDKLEKAPTPSQAEMPRER